MQQIRLFKQLERELALNYYEKLDDNASLVELTPELYEISLYGLLEEKDNLIAQLHAIGLTEIEVENLPDIDWVAHSLKNLAPVETNNFFIFGSHDKHRAKDEKLNIEINANQAFGTGHHNTSLGCLLLLEKYLDPAHKNILDIGTGTGILAMATAMLQAKQNIKTHIIASDIDPIAIKIAQENFKINKVEKTIKTLCAPGLAHEEILASAPFDLIMANILAKPLIELAAPIKEISHAKTLIILSGILEAQKDEVIKAYEAQQFKLKELLIKEEWASICLSL